MECEFSLYYWCGALNNWTDKSPRDVFTACCHNVARTSQTKYHEKIMFQQSNNKKKNSWQLETEVIS